jgi:hypothetical protein
VGVGKINSRSNELSPRIDDGSGCSVVSSFAGVLEMFLSQVGAGTINSGVKKLSPELDEVALGLRGVLLGDGDEAVEIKISGFNPRNSSRHSWEDHDLDLPRPLAGEDLLPSRQAAFS